MELVIRRARPADRAEVMAALRSDDYVPDVFDEWVRLRRDRLFVATLDMRVVGVARLSWLDPTHAWLEALRVHPRFRRRGVGRALMRHRIGLARDGGARWIAFSTAADNEPMRRNARALGFRVAARFQGVEATAVAGEPPARARRGDIAWLWRHVAGRDVMIGDGGRWRWQPLRGDDLRRAISRGLCFIDETEGEPRAFAIVDPRTSWLWVRVLVGSAPGRGRLLRALRAEARRRGLRKVGYSMPVPGIARTVVGAGFPASPWAAALLYAREL